MNRKTVYGLNWINGDGISTVYATKTQAQYNALINLVEGVMWDIQRAKSRNTGTSITEYLGSLKEDIEYFLDNEYIEDCVYLEYLDYFE